VNLKSLPTPLQRRIYQSIALDDATGCWVWKRQIANSGYGKLMIGGPDGTRVLSAHRASYSAFVGPLGDDAGVAQSCGNRLCVNPEHLELTVPGSATTHFESEKQP